MLSAYSSVYLYRSISFFLPAGFIQLGPEHQTDSQTEREGIWLASSHWIAVELVETSLRCETDADVDAVGTDSTRMDLFGTVLKEL
jgi:hypothetical protein